METRFFYLIENGKVVGFHSGTIADDSDKLKDPSNTEVALNEWAKAAPGRSIIIKDSPVSMNLNREHLVFDKGDIRPATGEEVTAMESAKVDAANAKAEAEDSLWASINAKLSVLGFTPDEIKAMNGGHW